ncbi:MULTISPECIES: DNA-binding protein [Salimicrobium]|uniref:DNA-binding protein n=1 Tax=Salimicrobium humidisoli TaxID=2029857 RepID=A0ABX4HQQ4_9BACI|nr:MULTISPECIES: DNA-binding protein [Salimicrobium]PBB05543.1 DNA-binding protein [Salimicrobium humidisoli]
MEFDFFWIAVGIAFAGYFIGEGLKNFKNPEAGDSFSEIFREEEDYKLIKEKDVHYYIGVSKEDAKTLLQEYPDIPHVTINDKIYYPKAQLHEWLKSIGT